MRIRAGFRYFCLAFAMGIGPLPRCLHAAAGAAPGRLEDVQVTPPGRTGPAVYRLKVAAVKYRMSAEVAGSWNPSTRRAEETISLPGHRGKIEFRGSFTCPADPWKEKVTCSGPSGDPIYTELARKIRADGPLGLFSIGEADFNRVREAAQKIVLPLPR